MARIDKWLWATRFFKTRSLAQKAIELGRIEVNQQRVKPAYNLQLNDEVRIQKEDVQWEIIVKNLSEVRGSATIAQTLYEETAASLARRESQKEQKKYFHEPSALIKSRPTKQDRRKIDKLKQSW